MDSSSNIMEVMSGFQFTYVKVFGSAQNYECAPVMYKLSELNRITLQGPQMPLSFSSHARRTTTKVFRDLLA